MIRKEVIVQDELGCDIVPRQRTLPDAAAAIVAELNKTEPGWVLTRVAAPPAPAPGPQPAGDLAWLAGSGLIG